MAERKRGTSRVLRVNWAFRMNWRGEIFLIVVGMVLAGAEVDIVVAVLLSLAGVEVDMVGMDEGGFGSSSGICLNVYIHCCKVYLLTVKRLYSQPLKSAV